MAVEKVNIEQFLLLADTHPVLDVRSPAEFKRAHIPGAVALPLFSDEERKQVGTTYKQVSREAAIKIGLDFFGPKMRRMVEEVEALLKSSSSPIGDRTSNNKTVLVHCWRGGMRSAGVAWLLDLYGFKVYTLAGGYKAYRNHVLDILSAPHNFQVLGGYTGSGKTFLLHHLRKLGENVIDLETLASHRGSAFGAIGQPEQPAQEMFENLLSQEIRNVSKTGREKKPIWLEDESQRIGLVNLPHLFWLTMRRAPVFFLEIPFEARLNHLVNCYGNLDKEKMINAIIRIKKRLGGLETKSAINFLLEENMKECFRILLKYYDKYYLKGLHNRESETHPITTIFCEDVHSAENAEKVLQIQHEQVVGQTIE